MQTRRSRKNSSAKVTPTRTAFENLKNGIGGLDENLFKKSKTSKLSNNGGDPGVEYASPVIASKGRIHKFWKFFANFFFRNLETSAQI